MYCCVACRLIKPTFYSRRLTTTTVRLTIDQCDAAVSTKAATLVVSLSHRVSIQSARFKRFTTIAMRGTTTSVSSLQQQQQDQRHFCSFKTTPDICDDCETTVRVIDPSLGFRNFGGKTHFGGQVVTVQCFEDNSMVKDLAKSMDGRNKVMIVDGGGSRRRALLGDMVATDCVQQGWEGLVIFGSIRDVDEIATLNLGVQALGSHPQKTQKRNEGQINVPVTFGGVTIQPGDYVVCDNNGITVNQTDPRLHSA
jgi:regulator of ribonuclease activity A